MIKKKLLVVIVLACLAAAVFSADLSKDQIINALWALTDSAAASFAGSVSNVPKQMPGITAENLPQGSLPDKLRYNDADMYSITQALAPQSGGIAGFLLQLLSNPSAAQDSPLSLACYYSLVSRGFVRGQYILNGTMDFSFDDPGISLNTLINSLLTGNQIENICEVDVDMEFSGTAYPEPFRLKGYFRASMTSSSKVEISYPNGFNIDEKEYGRGVMSFNVNLATLR